jgi:hypothetical protein
VEHVERADQQWIGLEELPRKSLNGVGEDKGVEAVLDRPAATMDQRAPIE